MDKDTFWGERSEEERKVMLGTEVQSGKAWNTAEMGKGTGKR